MKCPRCGQTRQPEASECSNCGVDLDYVARKATPAKTAASAPASRADASRDPAVSETRTADEDGPKTCPKCGCQNESRAAECLRCGIIFDKYEVYLEKRRRAEEETNQTTDGLLDPKTVQMAVQASRQSPSEAVYARTACPHCAQRYKIRTDQVGIITRCKKCSSIFKIERLPDIAP